MSKGLDSAINRFPEKEMLIRRLYQSEDFKELCEHYAWMKDSVSLETFSDKKQEFERLRNTLEIELRDILWSEISERVNG